MPARGPVNYQSLVIISLALHFSLLIYVFILYYLGYSNHWFLWTPDFRLFPGYVRLFYIFVPLSITMAALALLFPKLASRRTQAQNLGAIVPSSGLFYNFTPLTPEIQSHTIIRMAIAESVAILGFVLGYLNHAPLVAVPFVLAGLVVQFLVGPVFGRMSSRSDSLS